jgi:hypothetical protein
MTEENLCCTIDISVLNGNDHLRRLIQTAYVCFQQLNDCEELHDDRKQWIQTWMDAVSNVICQMKKKKNNSKHNS